MRMDRKIFIGVLLFIVIATGIFFFFTKTKENIKPTGISKTVVEEEKNPVVTLVLNDGEKIATYSGIAAHNAFEILTVVTKKENIPLVTKTYDFGVFIQKIGEKESGTALAWIYFINGKSGDVAADKATLTSGDVVEWKYTKSLY
jgi:hypothetical protein